MLCLRQEIGSDKVRISGLIGHDLHLRRARRHINRHLFQADPLLSCRHILIAWAEDLIDFRNGLRAISHRRNRLDTTCFEYFIYACHLCRIQHSRMHLSCCLIRRGTEHDLPTASDTRRHRQHQYGGKQRSRSSWDIEAHLLNRHRLLPATNTRCRLHLHTLKTLCRMETLNVGFRTLNRSFQFLRNGLIGLRHLL